MLGERGFGMNDYRLINAGLPETLGSEDETVTASARRSSGTNSSEWLVNVADDVVVPMITSEVVEALRAGRLNNVSLVWRIGMHDWSPLADVPQLRLAAGPSALPSATSTPGPVVHKPLGPAAEPARRNTLPMGFPAVRDPASVAQPLGLGLAPDSPLSTPRSAAPGEDAEALAVYDRPAASLTFSDSARAEWHGALRVANQSTNSPSPVPPSPVRRLTPVPPVPARLPASLAHSVAPNTLSPTTAEAEIAVSPRGPGAWGDRSVVFASELRAVKKTSKRLAVWAAIGSAALASLGTFWFARSAVPSAAPAAVAPMPAAAARDLEPVNVELPAPELLNAPPVAPAVAAAVVKVKVAPVLAVPRVVKRAKPPGAVHRDASPASDSASDSSDDSKASVAATLPLAAPADAPSSSATAPAAPADAPNAAPVPDPKSGL
jgi:GYF domain 2